MWTNHLRTEIRERSAALGDRLRFEVGSEHNRMALFVADRLRLDYDAIKLRANKAVRTERD